MKSYKSSILSDYSFSKKGYFDPNINIDDEIVEFKKFTLKRDRQLKLYLNFLGMSEQGGLIDSERSIEIHKGALDSIAPHSKVSVITPFADSFNTIDSVQKYDRVTQGNVVVPNREPVIINGEDYRLVPVRKDVSFLITQNPFDYADFKVLRESYESGKADIVAAIYGDVLDKDFETKRQILIDTFKENDEFKLRETREGTSCVVYVIGFNKEKNKQRSRM